MEEFKNVLNDEVTKGKWNDYTFGARKMQAILQRMSGDTALKDGQLVVVNHYGDFYIFEVMGHTEVVNDNTNIYVRPGTEAFYKDDGAVPYGKPTIVKAVICRLPTRQEVLFYDGQPTI